MDYSIAAAVIMITAAVIIIVAGVMIVVTAIGGFIVLAGTLLDNWKAGSRDATARWKTNTTAAASAARTTTKAGEGVFAQ